jgi:hypothetical protein
LDLRPNDLEHDERRGGEIVVLLSHLVKSQKKIQHEH